MDSGSGCSMQSSSSGDDDYGAVDSSQTTDAFSDFLSGGNPPIQDQQQHHQPLLPHFPSTTSPAGSLPSFLMESFFHSPQLMPLDWPPPLPSCSPKSPTLHRAPAPDDVPCSSAGLGASPLAWQQNSPLPTAIPQERAGMNATQQASTAATALAPRGPSSSSKKRSRASRRAPTTVLTTDTANFRQMVQEFTGIPSPPFSSLAFSTRPRTNSTAAFDILHAAAAAAASTTLPYRSSGSTVGGLGLLESSGLFRSLMNKSLNLPFTTGLSSSSSAPSGISTATATLPTGNSVSGSLTPQAPPPPAISSSTAGAASVHGAPTWPSVCTSAGGSTSCITNPNNCGAAAGSSYGVLSHMVLGSGPSESQLQSPLMRFDTHEPRSLPQLFQQSEWLQVLTTPEGAPSSAVQWTDRSTETQLTTGGSSTCRSGGGGYNQTGQASQRPLDFHADKAHDRSSATSIGEGMPDSNWICSLDN